MTPDRSIPPPVRSFDALSIPADNVETLANGMVLHTYSAGDQPICNISVQIQGGRAELGEGPGRLAVSQLSEGTAKYSADALADLIDFNGATTNYRLQEHHSTMSMSVLNHRAEAMLPVFADMLAEPIFDPDRLEVSKAIFIDNLTTSRMDPATIADETLCAMIMGGRHLLARPTCESDYADVTGDELRNLHSHRLSGTRTHIFLSGMLSDSITDAVRHELGRLPASGSGVEYDIKPFTPVAAGAIEHPEFHDTYQCAIAMGIPAIDRAHTDYVPLRLAVCALGGYFGSRLMANIREDKGLTYGISAALLGSLDGSYVNITAKCDRTYADAVIEEIGKELKRLATEPPRGEELERLRIYLATSLAGLLDSPAKVSGYYSTARLVGTPPDYFDRQFKEIMAMTPESIADMADKYLKPELLRTAVAGA